MRSSTTAYILMTVTWLALSGCVRESHNGDEQVFTYARWAGLATLLVGLVTTTVAWVLRRFWKRAAWLLPTVLGLIAVVHFAPKFFLDKVSLSPDGLLVRTGVWGLTSCVVRYDEVRSVRIASERKNGRAGLLLKDQFLVCNQSKGPAVKVPINNRLCREALPHILNALETRGIALRGERR